MCILCCAKSMAALDQISFLSFDIFSSSETQSMVRSQPLPAFVLAGRTASSQPVMACTATCKFSCVRPGMLLEHFLRCVLRPVLWAYVWSIAAYPALPASLLKTQENLVLKCVSDVFCSFYQSEILKSNAEIV